MAHTVTVKYFSWIRERVGIDEEQLDLPDELSTVGTLLDWLSQRNEQFAHALEQQSVVRVALDMQHAHHDEDLGIPKEIALFPPMTGG